MTNANDLVAPKIKTDAKFHNYNQEQFCYGDTYGSGGLTKREYFAAMAMQGILANSENNCVDLFGVNGNGRVGFIEATKAASEAVIYADVLIAALNKPIH